MSVITGRQALRSIRSRVERAKKDYDRISGYVHELEGLHGGALEEEREVLTELAEAYLPELSYDAVVSGLAQLKLRVGELLQRQDERKETLLNEIQAHRARLAEAENRLEALKARGVEVEERVVATRAAVATALEADGEYRAWAEEHAGLMDRRDKLKARRARLLAVASVERPAYEGFAPFRHLKERAFGEPEYRAGWITRLFDRWLARRIDFPRLDRNHRLLKVGPHQIQAEILRSSRRAGELEAAMDETEQDAAVAEALPETLEELAAAHEGINKAREARDAARSEYEARDGELREIDANRGRYYEEAIELHRQHLGGKSIQELEALARKTPGGEDDRLVRRLDDFRLRLDQVEKSGRERLGELEEAREKVDGLLRIEEAGWRDFGSFRSHFRDGFALDPLIDQFMTGEASWGAVVDQMNNFHFRRPIFGPMAEALLGGILSELAASFVAPPAKPADPAEPAEPVEPADPDEHTVISLVFRDADGGVSRRVTRRRTGKGSGRGTP